METVIKKAHDPITGQEYQIELPAHDVVRKAILELDYPEGGIKVKETADTLAENFKLSEKEKNAGRWRGKRYLNVFRYDIVAPAFKYLLGRRKLKQPEGSGKPYIRTCDVPPPPSFGGSIEEIYQQIRAELATELLQKIKDNTPTFFEELVIDLLVAMGYGGSREDAQAVGRSR